MKRLVAFFLTLVCALGVFANEAVPMAEDPVVEQRLIVIAEELRCLVCQNESLEIGRASCRERV